MQYTVEIEVARPLAEVVESFASRSNMPYWQEGLLSDEPLEGEPGQEGSKARLTFRMGKRTMVMVETIEVRDLPERFHAFYETKGVRNRVAMRFEAAGENRTRLISDNEFVFTAWMMRVMGAVFGSMFRKQSMKYLTDFKAFAEHGTDVRQRAR
ncbi:MAG: hypothetical protein RL562_1412 [Planctomycetota bacterium]|jgi:uncharacterized membrane protein